MKRREFLKVSAIAGGGLSLSIFYGGCAHRASRGEMGDDEGAKPSAWLRIYADDRFVFVLDRVEMGQGTMTASAMMLCEELELDPDRLEVEMAPVDPAYVNTRFRAQATGGSTSTASSWVVLRRAGATTREMLRAAAMRKWNVPLSEIRVENGVVYAGERRATYGELAANAVQHRVPKPELKKKSEWTLIGKPRQRLDARPKVEGSAMFGMDVQVPGMFTAVVVRAPRLGAKVLGFDAKEALAVRGVEHVVQIPSGVAVAARGAWQARKGARALKIEWGPGTADTLTDESLGAAHGKALENEGAPVTKVGDAATTIAKTKGKVVRARYEVPYLSHAPMEPMNATAWVKANSCEVWAPTQSNMIAREAASRVAGLPLRAVTVHTTYLGGGFGRRSMVDFVEEAVHVSRAIGAPAKVMWTREDDMQNGYLRPRVTSDFVGVVEDGVPTVWTHKLAGQSVLAYVASQLVGALPPEWLGYVVKDYVSKRTGTLFREGTVPDITTMEGAAHIPYAIANQDVRFVQHEPGVPVTFWRAVGHSFNGFLVESFIDELAHAAGKDPYTFRKGLLREHPRERAVLELAASKAGWEKPAAEGVFRGIAQHSSFGSACAQVVELSVAGSQIKLHRVVCAVDVGTVVNPEIVRAQSEGGIVFGLSSALKHAIAIEGGRIVNQNFHDYPVLRIHETPLIETHIVESDESPSGVGEITLPPIAAAVANAIFAATGERLRRLPLEPAMRQAFLKNTEAARVAGGMK